MKVEDELEKRRRELETEPKEKEILEKYKKLYRRMSRERAMKVIARLMYRYNKERRKSQRLSREVSQLYYKYFNMWYKYRREREKSKRFQTSRMHSFQAWKEMLDKYETKRKDYEAEKEEVEILKRKYTKVWNSFNEVLKKLNKARSISDLKKFRRAIMDIIDEYTSKTVGQRISETAGKGGRGGK